MDTYPATEPTTRLQRFGWRIRYLLREYPEAVWILVLVAALYAGARWLTYHEPNSGEVDGFAGLWPVGMAILEGVLITGMAWLSKKSYTRDLTGFQEDEAYTAATYRWPALATLIVDRLEWAAWIGLWFVLLR